MAERRRGKKKRELDDIVDDDKSQKIEFEVAKYLRSKLPSKRTTLLGHKVDYFIASKAIDCLLDSKWAKNEKGEEAMFTTRDSVVGYMQRMLVHQFFHRAKPIIVSKKDNRKKGDDPPESSAAEDAREKKKDKAKKEKEKKEKSDKDGEKEKDKSKDSKSSKGEGDDKDEKDESKDTENKDENDDKESTTKEVKEKKEGKDGERKKEKKKVKLDMHLEQIFVDGNHPYVWIYDPIPVKTWFIGALFVIAAIAICLFPLWPKTVRNFVYYLSLAGAGFLLFVFSLVILRFVIFVIIWLLTFGKHNFWILPNLTEDVGVLESFWPLYQYEYKGGKKNEDKDDDGSKDEDEKGDSKEKSKGKKEKKSKIEDDQTGDEGLIDDKRINRKGSKTTEDEDEEEEEEEEEERSDEVTEEDGEDAPLLESDDGSSNPVKLNAGDNDNGFEILDVHESS